MQGGIWPYNLPYVVNSKILHTEKLILELKTNKQWDVIQQKEWLIAVVETALIK